MTSAASGVLPTLYRGSVKDVLGPGPLAGGGSGTGAVLEYTDA
jgi:hypothetical protein